MAYKCIIFDCDGVLVDSEPLANQMLVTMANELNIPIDLEFAIQQFIGRSLYDCISIIESFSKKKLPTTFEADFRHRSFELFKKELQPVAGIKTLLPQLKIPFCVASSGPMNKIELNLKLTGLYSYFEGNLFSCYQVQQWKPSPEVFWFAAKTMGFAPEDCLVVEDSLPGIKAAVNGGFDVVAYQNQFNQQQLRSENITKIGQLTDLLYLIN